MKRLFIVYNPNSSRFSDVKKDILDHLKDLKGHIIGKYEVEPTDVDKNTTKFAKILQDGDLVIAAGGDATGIVASNAILKSGKDATLMALPYGNFNDLARTLGTSGVTWTGDRKNAKDKQFEVVCDNGSKLASEPRNDGRERSGPRTACPSVQRFYPLEIYVDGKFFRYATCYVTIGMMAEAVKLYDTQKMRKILKTAHGRKVGSYTNLAKWYFKNRHKKQFLPDFELNGKLQPKKTSDYCAINGKYMARVMKGGEDYQNPTTFRSETDRLTSFWRLSKLMFKSIFFRVPGAKTKGDKIEFLEPATVELQAEGEYKVFENIKTIEIRKSKKCLKVVTKN